MEELLCIKTHSSGKIKKGDLCVLKNTKKLSCCGHEVYDVGVIGPIGLIAICNCGAKHKHVFGLNHPFSHTIFAKLNYDEANEALEDLLEETIYQEELVRI